MSETKLVAELRTESGKGAARRARRAGYVPAIVYGNDIEPVKIQLSRLELERFVANEGTGRLVNLEVGDKQDLVLLKDVQRHPVRGEILHADFHKVRLDQEVTVTVPIVLAGEETERTADGGIITVSAFEVTVSCLPTQIPESIEVSVEGLEIGSTVTVADLKVPEGVTVQDDPELVVVTVIAPQAGDAADTDEEGAEAAEDEAAEAAEESE